MTLFRKKRPCIREDAGVKRRGKDWAPGSGGSWATWPGGKCTSVRGRLWAVLKQPGAAPVADSCVRAYARDPPTALTKTSLLSQMHDVLRKPSPGSDYLPSKTPGGRTAALTAPALLRIPLPSLLPHQPRPGQRLHLELPKQDLKTWGGTEVIRGGLCLRDRASGRRGPELSSYVGPPPARDGQVDPTQDGVEEKRDHQRGRCPGSWAVLIEP